VSAPLPLPRPSPTLAAVAAQPTLATGLPLHALVDLRRQAACVVAELDARIALAQAPTLAPFTCSRWAAALARRRGGTRGDAVSRERSRG
jgi:hypothetical protein